MNYHQCQCIYMEILQKNSPNFQETSHNHSTFKTNKQNKFFSPGITWSHHVLREFRGRWFEYRLTGIAGACRRSHWHFSEVPVGRGGNGKVRATMWCCYKDSMAKHKFFFWELHVNPCVYHESCRLFCLACAYYIPSGVQLFFHQ